jgi:tellurium resistance protein TerD
MNDLVLEIISKGATLDLNIASKQEGSGVFYFGAGWDNPNGPVDLDLVAAVCRGGKLTSGADMIYFGNRFATGVALSEDNTTGEGDGDDEDIVIDTSKLDADVDMIVIGLVAYSNTDFVSAPNPHFRICDGAEEESPQIADVPVTEAATAGDTGLVACTLSKNADGHWVCENTATMHKMGNGSTAIQNWGKLFG